MSEPGSLTALKHESGLQLLETLTRVFIATMLAVSLLRYLMDLPLPWPALAIQALYGFGLLWLPGLARRSHSLYWPSLAMLLGLLLVIFVVSLGAGGLNAPIVIALPFLPLLAAIFLGRRSMPGFIFLIALFLLLLQGAHCLELIQAQRFDPQTRSLLQLIMVVMMTLLCAGLGYYTDYHNEQMHQQLMLWANTDGLTGVANRRLFDEGLKQEWLRNQRMGRPLSLLLVDIDHFKHYNDAYGHVEGDRCLAAIAQAISYHCRRSGEMVARYGGEEFAVILPNVGLPEAAHIADSLLADISALYDRGNPDLKQTVTVSIGFACTVPRQGEQPERFVIQADEALYRAKRAGRNQSVGASGPGLWVMA